MAIFSRKEKYVDLSKRLERNQERVNSVKASMVESEVKEEPAQSSSGFFGSFFSGSSTASSVSDAEEERKKKLSERLIALTNRIEEQEKEIFQLKQKVEMIERKQRAGY